MQARGISRSGAQVAILGNDGGNDVNRIRIHGKMTFLALLLMLGLEKKIVITATAIDRMMMNRLHSWM